tara:strand:+ start:71 stop:337 length:267 start_codon:yes stop_codon:yes gene_type:complete
MEQLVPFQKRHYLIVSENGKNIENTFIKKYIIYCNYEEIADKVKEVYNNYETFYNRIYSDFDLSYINDYYNKFYSDFIRCMISDKINY